MEPLNPSEGCDVDAKLTPQELFIDAVKWYDENRDNVDKWKEPFSVADMFYYLADEDAYTPEEVELFRQLMKQEFSRRIAALIPGINETQSTELSQLANDFLGIPLVMVYRKIIDDNLNETLWKQALEKNAAVDGYAAYTFISIMMMGIRYDGRVPMTDYILPAKEHHLTDYEKRLIDICRKDFSGNLLSRMFGRSTATVSKFIKEKEEEHARFRAQQEEFISKNLAARAAAKIPNKTR